MCTSRIRFVQTQNTFSRIPGSIVSYWLSPSFLSNFSEDQLIEHASPKTGFTTGDNDKYLRFWFEIDNTKIKSKWFYLNKGGEFRKWYGDNEYVVNWEEDGRDIKANPGCTIRNPTYYFKEGVTWSKICSRFAGRYSKEGTLFDAVGLLCVPDKDIPLHYVLAFFNTNVAEAFMDVLNPTLSYTTGAVASLPIRYDEDVDHRIERLVSENIALSEEDWGSFETSWDFKRHPLR